MIVHSPTSEGRHRRGPQHTYRLTPNHASTPTRPAAARVSADVRQHS